MMIKGVVRLDLGGNMKLKKLAALVLAGALCFTSLVGCGVKPDETAATLGDKKVTAGVANFICMYQKATIDDTYVAYFGNDFWQQDMYGYQMIAELEKKFDSTFTMKEGTLYPILRIASQRLEPINPAPPVTRNKLFSGNLTF